MGKHNKSSANTSRVDAGPSVEPTMLDLYNLMIEQAKKLQKLAEDNETLATRLLSIDEKLTASQQEVQFLKQENQDLKHHVALLELDLNAVKQDQLSNNLIISGAGVFEEGKSPTECFKEIAENLGKTFNNSDICDVYTLRRRSGSQLVVKFANAQHKFQMIDRMRSNRRSAETGDAQFPLANVFFNDHLTPYFENLWYKCRMLKKKSSLAHAWTKMGKLYVRKEEGTAAIRIRSNDDLLQIYSEYGVEVDTI